MHKRSVTLKGHRTSISLEAPFWEALEKLAREDEKSLAGLISIIDRSRVQETPQPGLSSALRLYVLKRLQEEKC